MRHPAGIALTTALCFAVILGVTGPVVSQAQAPACTYFDLSLPVLNIRRTPAKPGGYFEALEQGEIACVTEQRKIGNESWAFIRTKTTKAGTNADIAGWVKMKYLEPAPAPKNANPPAVVATKPEPTPPAAVPTKPATADEPKSTETSSALQPAAPDGTLSFNSPGPFEAPPLRGRTLKELATGVPLFSPTEGIPDELWKRSCSSCHQWNKESLCERGKSFLKRAREVLRNPHPYGGTYKLALMKWSKTGCQ